MKLKKVSVLMAVLVLSLGLVGCQGATNGDSEKEPNANVSSEKEAESETDSGKLDNGLSQERLEWFETEFFNTDENHIVNFFLASEYDKIADINLRKLFYNGDDGRGGNGEVPEEEITLVLSRYNLEKLDVSRAMRAEMNEVLETYAGLTLDTTNKVGLDSLYYIKENDAYYNVAGDTAYMKCAITKGWTNEDGTITLQYTDGLSSISDTYEVTLKAVGDSYQFVSNKRVAK